MAKFKPVVYTFYLIVYLTIVGCTPVRVRTFPLEAHLPQVPVTPTEFTETGGILPPVVSTAHSVHNVVLDAPARMTPDECLELKTNILPATNVKHPVITPSAPLPPIPHLEPLPVSTLPHPPTIIAHQQAPTHTFVENIEHPIITPPAPPPPLPHLQPLPVPHFHHQPHFSTVMAHEQGPKNTFIEHVEHPAITPPAPPPPLPHLQPLPMPAMPHTQTFVAHEECPQPTFVEHVEHPIITPPAPPPPLPLLDPLPAPAVPPMITHPIPSPPAQPAVVAYDDCGEIKTVPAVAPPKLPIPSPLPVTPLPTHPAPTPTPIAPLPHPVDLHITQDDCVSDDTVEILAPPPSQPSHETFVETGPTHGFELQTEPPTHIIHPPSPPPALPLPQFKIVATPANMIPHPIVLPYAHVPTPVEPPKNVNLENVSITGLGPAPAPPPPTPPQSECIDLSSIFDWEKLLRRNGGVYPTIPNV